MACKRRAKGPNFTREGADGAVALAKCMYYLDGVKRYLYLCEDLECYGLPDNIHLGPRLLRRSRNLNTPLVNFYNHWDNFGKGKPARSEQAYRKRIKVRRRIPLMTWEGEGGALRPEEWESASNE